MVSSQFWSVKAMILAWSMEGLPWPFVAFEGIVLETEQGLRVARAGRGEFLRRHVHQSGENLQYVRQVHGFVAARARTRPKIARQQIGRIGLDHHPVQRQMADRGAQGVAASLVAD